VRKDRRNGADIAARFGWQFRFPGRGVKVLDKNLVDAIVGCKDPRSGSAKLNIDFVWMRSHGSLLLEVWIKQDLALV
jgi:hypothetical protein